MIKGPTEYIPPIEVEIVTKRYAIALDENEGIYVRNIKTGQVIILILSDLSSTDHTNLEVPLDTIILNLIY